MKEGLHPHRECGLTRACPGSWLLRSLKLSSLLSPEGWDEPKPPGGTVLDQMSLRLLALLGGKRNCAGHMVVLLCRAQGITHLSVMCC